MQTEAATHCSANGVRPKSQRPLAQPGTSHIMAGTPVRHGRLLEQSLLRLARARNPSVLSTVLRIDTHALEERGCALPLPRCCHAQTVSCPAQLHAPSGRTCRHPPSHMTTTRDSARVGVRTCHLPGASAKLRVCLRPTRQPTRAALLHARVLELHRPCHSGRQGQYPEARRRLSARGDGERLIAHAREKRAASPQYAFSVPQRPDLVLGEASRAPKQ